MWVCNLRLLPSFFLSVSSTRFALNASAKPTPYKRLVGVSENSKRRFRLE
jgi:hypothetical protein